MRIILILTALLALAFGGWWVWGSRQVDARLAALTRDLRAAGWTVDYATDGTGGFPYRFDLDLRDLALVSPDGAFGWQSPRLRAVAQSYDPGRLILAADETHRVSIPGQDLDIRVAGPRASGAVEIGEALPLTEFTLEASDLAVASSAGWESGAAALLAALRPSGGVNGYDAYARLEGVALPAGWRGAAGLPETVERAVIDAELSYDAPLALSGAPAALERVSLGELRIDWGEVTIEGSGELAVDAQGAPEGEIVLRATGWERLVELAAAMGVPIARSSLLQGALSAMAEDGVLTAPITFSGGEMRLGFLPLGPAPLLR